MIADHKSALLLPYFFITFTFSIQFVFAQLGNNAFRAYLQNKETKEWKFGPTNRPMFDLLSVVFSEEEYRKKIIDNNINLEALIIELFTTNEKFYDAFLPTTHSKEKTECRYNLFLERLNNI